MPPNFDTNYFKKFSTMLVFTIFPGNAFIKANPRNATNSTKRPNIAKIKYLLMCQTNLLTKPMLLLVHT
jgi:hypothetical protein